MHQPTCTDDRRQAAAAVDFLPTKSLLYHETATRLSLLGILVSVREVHHMHGMHACWLLTTEATR
jgi:hypothetical protein